MVDLYFNEKTRSEIIREKAKQLVKLRKKSILQDRRFIELKVIRDYLDK